MNTPVSTTGTNLAFVFIGGQADPDSVVEYTLAQSDHVSVPLAAVAVMSAAMTALGHLMERNVSEVFGERDPDRRRRAIAELYAGDCALYDADGETIGQAAVSDRVGRILGESPPGFAFSLVGPAEVIHDLGRLRWQTGPAGAPPVASGMDVAVFVNGKIQTLYTFIEAPVAAGA